MRARSPLSILLFLFAWLVAACGDDGSSSSSSSQGGGGSGQGGGTTSSTTGSSSSSSTGGGEGGATTAQGGGGQGGQAAGGASQGGSGQGGAGQGGASQGGAGQGGAGGGGMNPADTSQQIADVIATPDGTGYNLPIEGALVTYTKPQLGADPPGFFLQAEQAGPALFVAIDPAVIVPAIAVGDRIDLFVTDMGTLAGLRIATGIFAVSVKSSGNPIAPLVTNINAATDLVMNLDAYAARVVSFGPSTLATPFTSAGAPQVASKLVTTGLTDDNLRLRVPEAIRAQFDLQQNCSVSVDYGVMWRFNTVAQPSVYDASDLTTVTCDAPNVASAVAASATSVQVKFSRTIDAATITANGSQFTIPGLAVTAASAMGNTVTLTTASQTPNTDYTVSVANTVKDTLGKPLGMPSSAMFKGFVVKAVLRINELNANIANGCDLIELRAVSGGSIAGFSVLERGAVIHTFPNINVAKNDLIVVHLNSTVAGCNPSGFADETMSITQFSGGGSFATAWDFYSTDSGLTNTDNVIEVRDNLNAIVDAVLVADAPTGMAAAGSESAAAIVAAAMQWVMVGGGIPTGGFVDDNFRMHAALDLNATGTAVSGESIRRIDNLDDNDKADWLQGASTWGLINAGQSPF